jgi:glycosyltransferase involved in cell wall biosynthesis
VTLRLHHISHAYRSHARAARDYNRVLRRYAHVTDTIEEAQAALIHLEPHDVPPLLRAVPALARRYTIGFYVWETDWLPGPMREGVEVVDEVWTASLYCYHVFSRYHRRVFWIPHIVTPMPPPTAADVAAVAEILAPERRTLNILTITHAMSRRKNEEALIEAFHYAHQRFPNARLIIKTTDETPTVHVSRAGPVTTVSGIWTDGMISALYDRAHVYASAHCSEGWGLTLSDAMCRGVLTVATAYSGNMDFMTAGNSLLVDFDERNIDPRHLYYYFAPGMRWAYARRDSLEAQLVRALLLVESGEAAPIVARAARDIRRYDARHVGVLVRDRLRHIAALCGER